MRIRLVLLALAIVGGTTVTGSASADTTKQAKKIRENAAKKVSYVNELAAFDREQIEIGKLCRDKATNEQVRDFGSRLVTGHTEHLDQLTDWATSKAIEIAVVADVEPTLGTGGSGADESVNKTMEKHDTELRERSQKFKQSLDELSLLSGPAFDKRFLELSEKQHKGELSHIKDGLKEYEGDGAFSAFLLKSQSSVEAHLSELKALRRNVKG